MNKRNRECPVVGCTSRSNTNIKFFRFPLKKTGKAKSFWKLFTRIKDFKPIASEALCELHFAPERIKINKNKTYYLQQDTVPTIYYKGGQKIEVCYHCNIT